MFEQATFHLHFQITIMGSPVRPNAHYFCLNSLAVFTDTWETGSLRADNHLARCWSPSASLCSEPARTSFLNLDLRRLPRLGSVATSSVVTKTPTYL